MTIREKRAYAPMEEADGFRIYVDRLWPHGLSHEKFHYDLWDKEIAPSNDLRHWFHEDPQERWPEFAAKYLAELQGNPAVKDLEKTLAGNAVITLLYSSHDPLHNNAVVLKEFLQKSQGA